MFVVLLPNCMLHRPVVQIEGACYRLRADADFIPEHTVPEHTRSHAAGPKAPQQTMVPPQPRAAFAGAEQHDPDALDVLLWGVTIREQPLKPLPVRLAQGDGSASADALTIPERQGDFPQPTRPSRSGHKNSRKLAEYSNPYAEDTTVPTKNVVMISIDDMLNIVRFRDAFGPTFITPNIDRLLEMGVNFINANSVTSVCKPSRTSTMASLMPHDTGVFSNVDTEYTEILSPYKTLLGYFSGNGYFTATRGKLFHNVTTDDYADLSVPSEGRVSLGNDITISGPSPWTEEQARDAVTASWGADFIRQHNSDLPYFLSLGIHKPHLSWNVPQEYFDLYNIDDIDLSQVSGFDFDALPEFFQQFLASGQNFSDAEWREFILAYMASVSVIDALDESGGWSNTTLLLWSDHGHHLGDQEHWGKFTLFEAANSVPFIVVDPEHGVPGTTVTTPVSLLDVFPTLASLTGIPQPQGVRGLDLTPLMDNPSADIGRDGAVSLLFGSISARSETHRINMYNDGVFELFDVVADPYNRNNLLNDPSNNTLFDEMRIFLRKAAQDVGITVVFPGEVVVGTAEADTFIVGGDGIASGGDGDDVYFLGGTGNAIEANDGGNDTIHITTSDTRTFSLEQYPNIENIQRVNYSRSAVIIGNDKDNTIVGSPNRATSMQGRVGNDTIIGGIRDDRLEGGPGRDLLDGRSGNDTLFGGSGADAFLYDVSLAGMNLISDYSQAEGDRITLINLPVNESLILTDGSGGATIALGAFSVIVEGVSVAELVFAEPVGQISDSDLRPNSVARDAPIGTPVGITAIASDAEPVDDVNYSLSDNAGGLFAVDPELGIVTVAQDLGGSSATRHEVQVVARSTDGSQTKERFSITVEGMAPPPADWILTVRTAGTGGPSLSPSFRVIADGNLIGTETIANPGTNTERRDGLLTFETFEFELAASPSQVVIEYFNDGRDPFSDENLNLIVDYIAVNGVVFESEVDGVYSRRSGAIVGPTDTMLWNGFLRFEGLPDMT